MWNEDFWKETGDSARTAGSPRWELVVPKGIQHVPRTATPFSGGASGRAPALPSHGRAAAALHWPLPPLHPWVLRPSQALRPIPPTQGAPAPLPFSRGDPPPLTRGPQHRHPESLGKGQPCCQGRAGSWQRGQNERRGSTPPQKAKQFTPDLPYKARCSPRLSPAGREGQDLTTGWGKSLQTEVW